MKLQINLEEVAASIEAGLHAAYNALNIGEPRKRVRKAMSTATKKLTAEIKVQAKEELKAKKKKERKVAKQARKKNGSAKKKVAGDQPAKVESKRNKIELV